jgi:pimeloyl-ACP methyl ester carboxylesterase
MTRPEKETTMRKHWLGRAFVAAALSAAVWATAPGAAPTTYAFGEAGPLRLAQVGNFVVNAQVTEDGGVTNQMYVEFMIPEEQRYPYPVVLVHGGGGQGTDWKSTVDGRDGWANYLVNAGFAVYIIDRPGSARSIANSTYRNGELGGPADTGGTLGNAPSANWPGAPMIWNEDGTPDVEGWREANRLNPTIVAWAATSPRTPFASNEVSIEAQAALLERIGPAVVFTHSAGGTTAMGSSLKAAAGDNVVGILAFESGGAHVYANQSVENGQWSNGGPAEAMLSEQAIPTGMCELQTAPEKSRNLTLANVKMAFLNSARFAVENSQNLAECAAAQAREAGVEAIGVYMPDHEGGEGSGHFAMSETVNGEIAVNILVPALAWLQGEALPAGFKTY